MVNFTCNHKHILLFSLLLTFSVNKAITFVLNERHLRNVQTKHRITQGIAEYQAEDQNLVLNGGDVDNAHIGWEGTGYVKMSQRAGKFIEWDGIIVPAAGQYNLKFRFSVNNDGNSRVCTLFVNGLNVQMISFQETGSFNHWITTEALKLSFRSTWNKIKLVGNTDGKGPAIDWFQLEPVVSTPSTTTGTTTTGTTTTATPTTGITNIRAPVTYRPGDLTVESDGLLLSRGLQSRIIAKTGEPVAIDIGGGLGPLFHPNPDGADVFELSNGDYCYVSNSEVNEDGKGGVGSICFNSHGQVKSYQMILTGTRKNCSGGRTPWGTWLSAEEYGKGQIHEVEPSGNLIFPGGRSHQVTNLSIGNANGDRYESLVCDKRNPNAPVFYYTVDSPDGQVTKYIPNPYVMLLARQRNDYSKVLTSTPSSVQFLKLNPVFGTGGGTFEWIDGLSEGKRSAQSYFQHCEGIEFDENQTQLFITCKANRQLFILNMDNFRYTEESTDRAFGGKPDQLRMMCFEDDSKLLYFAEEGGDQGVYARYEDGSFVPILRATHPRFDRDESSGIAFSPNNLHMYVAFYDNGEIVEITREDGYPFNSQHLPLSLSAQVWSQFNKSKYDATPRLFREYPQGVGKHTSRKHTPDSTDTM